MKSTKRRRTTLIAAPKRKVTCGVIVFRRSSEGVEVLLARGEGNSYWELPKGHKEPGETNREAAVRETFEEVGVSVDVSSLTTIGHVNSNGKRSVFFATEADVTPVVDDKEFDEATARITQAGR